jgi:hypothetical protein
LIDIGEPSRFEVGRLEAVEHEVREGGMRLRQRLPEDDGALRPVRLVAEVAEPKEAAGSSCFSLSAA